MYAALTSLNIFAATATNPNAFWETGAGGLIKALLGVAGVFVILYTVFKSIAKFAKGTVGEGVKIIVTGLVVSVFLFRPEIIGSLVSLVGDIMQSLFGDNGVGGVVKDNGGTAK